MGFEPVTSRYRRSYEATEVGSWSIMCSYVPVKEMNVIDVYKSYKNCEDHSSFDFISAVLNDVFHMVYTSITNSIVF